jgi:predicted DNA-binding transcriptional regulator YafY
MSNLHRIKWIDECLRNNKYPNCRTIADRFEISTRQAYRDIEYLKYSLDAPLEYSAENRGYYCSDEYYTIPAGFISEEEKNTLSYLAYRYRNLGSETASKIAELFDKLTDSKHSPEFDDTSTEVFKVKPLQANNYDPIKQAIDKCLKIKVHYRNAKEEISKRTLLSRQQSKVG